MTNPLAHITPLAADRARALLHQVVERARTHAPKSIVAFDLDSTLLNNRPRQAHILREYGTELGIDTLANSTPDHWHTGWDEGLAMTNAGLTKQEAESHREPFKAFWWNRFFTSEYCQHDIAIPGAARYVRALLETNATIIYLTGRQESMRRGTLTSFERAGFPLPNDSQIHLWMKPSLNEHDDAFKDRSMHQLRERGVLVAAFDNEPTHINFYRQAFPEALSIHLATDCSPRLVSLAAGISSIADFDCF